MRRGATAESGARVAAVALVAAAALLWLVPPVGVAAAVAAGLTLAPWGRRLGERVILSTAVGAGAVAVVLAAQSALGTALPSLGWRGLITLTLLAELACLRVPRTAPALPVVRADDWAGVAVGALLFALLWGPYAGATTAQSLDGLLAWWAGGEIPHDHSSHLPMFHQVMAAQGWNFESLPPDLLFSVYPMLHVGLWSVGEWAAGVAPTTPGINLIAPYIAWSSLTAALAAAMLTWSAGLAARALAGRPRPRANRAPRPRVELSAALAALVTGLWCVLGSMALMAAFAAANFLIAAGIVIGAVTASARSRAALLRISWFALPLAGVAAAHLYPTLGAGLVLPGIAAAYVLARESRRRLVALVVVGAVCLAASVPATRSVTDSPRGGPWGSLTGGLPAFEYWPAIVLALIVLIALPLGWRTPGRLVTAGLLGPTISAAVLTAYFVVEAARSGLPVGDSYYANKMIYALLMASVPLVSAVVAGWAARRVPAERGRRRTMVIGVCALVALVAVAEVSTLTRRPGMGGGVLQAPAGVVAIRTTLESVSRQPLVGDVVVTAIGTTSPDGRATVTWIPVERSVTGARGEYVNLFAGRTANGLRDFATLGLERSTATIDIISRTADPVASLSELLTRAPDLSVTLVVPDQEVADTLAPVVKSFGPTRLRVVVAEGG